MTGFCKFISIILLVVLCIWSSVSAGLWKSDAQKFAEATCPSNTLADIPGKQKFKECVVSKFSIGTNAGKLYKYLEGANFEGFSGTDKENLITQKYIQAIRYEKGVAKKFIIFSYDRNSGLIKDIRAFRGITVESEW
jgi:hypothetical protein